MGAEFLTSPLLTEAGFRHAFFTRGGGVSAGAYASLNLSSSVGDNPDSVAENLVRAAAVLGLPPERLLVPSQVHGAEWLVLGPSDTASSVRLHEADAVLSTEPGLACCVQTADCIPLLIGDPKTGLAAAIHAGWRGVVQNIAGKVAAQLMIQNPGAHLLAAIGPHISADAFEVSDDVADALALASAAGASVIDRPGLKPHVDLRSIVRSQLETAGLNPSLIDDVFGCTRRQEALFFSYRRQGRHSGRHVSAIRPLA